MAVQLQERVSQHQECLSNLRQRFIKSETHRFLTYPGDFQACPRILRELADELTAWNRDVGCTLRGQDYIGSTSTEKCLDEISQKLELLKNLFDLDAGEQEIDSDQGTRYTTVLYDAFDETGTLLSDLRDIPNPDSPNRPRSAQLDTALHYYEELKSYFYNQMRDPSLAPRQSPLPSPHKHDKRSPQQLKHGTVDFLWTMLPVPRELRETPNWKDRKDGVIVDWTMLDKTRKVLKAYYEAWKDHVGELADEKIKEMAKIAVTLNIIKARTYLDKFLGHRYDDLFFPFELNVLKRDIFDDSSEAQRFYDQQFRVASRDWSGGDRIDLNEAEPIPFKIEQIFEPGSFSSVQRVRNVFTHKSYAIKYSNKKAIGAEHHMENEIKHLREVCNKQHVPHIVRVEKVFTRGREFGVLMSPAATTNLQRILERFVKDVPARTYLRGEFLKGFGCLSHTLCYMHNEMNTRHRDIKPQNILFDWPNNDSRYTRFLWSDFGLAQKFSIQEGSATNSGFNRGTDKYVAPEVLMDKEKHGRSADVFSFGCVMFEALGCILGGQYDNSTEATETSFPKLFHPHHGCIEQMHDYLDRLRAGQEHNNLEHLVLAKWLNRKLKVDDILSRCLTKKMTNRNPQDRPKIDEVVVELATMHYQGLDVFCPTCFDEVKTGYKDKRAFMHRGEKRKSWHHFWSPTPAQPSRKVKA